MIVSINFSALSHLWHLCDSRRAAHAKACAYFQLGSLPKLFDDRIGDGGDSITTFGILFPVDVTVDGSSVSFEPMHGNPSAPSVRLGNPSRPSGSLTDEEISSSTTFVFASVVRWCVSCVQTEAVFSATGTDTQIEERKSIDESAV